MRKKTGGLSRGNNPLADMTFLLSSTSPVVAPPQKKKQRKHDLCMYVCVCIFVYGGRPSLSLCFSLSLPLSLSGSGLVFRGMDRRVELGRGACVKGNVVEFPGFTSASTELSQALKFLGALQGTLWIICSLTARPISEF